MDRNSRKVRQGIVSSSAMDKTITVVVEDRKRHPIGSDCGKEEVILLE